MLVKVVICLFKGHDVDPDESIIGDEYIYDKRELVVPMPSVRTVPSP